MAEKQETKWASKANEVVFLAMIVVGGAMVLAMALGKSDVALTALGGILGWFLAARAAAALELKERDWQKLATFAAVGFVAFALYAGLLIGNEEIAGAALGGFIGFLGRK